MITDARNILVSWYIFKLIGEIITKWKLGLVIEVFRSIGWFDWLTPFALFREADSGHWQLFGLLYRDQNVVSR